MLLRDAFFLGLYIEIDEWSLSADLEMLGFFCNYYIILFESVKPRCFQELDNLFGARKWLL